MIFDGERWQVEKTHLAFEFAKRVAREAACEKGEKEAKALASNHTAAAIVNLARADRKIAATAEQWDIDPWLLNTPGGTIDLRTGEMRAPWAEGLHHAGHGSGARPACAPARSGSPSFTASSAATPQLIGYVQRVLGYALTGSTSEQALFFGYGTGANGKSVLIETVSGIMGDYAKSAPIETFTLASGERHPTELAGLRGCSPGHGRRDRGGPALGREPDQGPDRRRHDQRLDSCVRTSSNLRPQFKLLIAGNHKPGLRSVDEAIRRRFNLLPFAVTIPAGERDPELAKRLQAEWPGILALDHPGVPAGGRRRGWSPRQRWSTPPRNTWKARTPWARG